MPWCPTCRSEYREGFTQCADCGADLVDELPPEAEKAVPSSFVCRDVAGGADPFADEKYSDDEQPVFLVGLQEEAETLRLCEVLDSCHIAAFPIHRPESAVPEAADEAAEDGEGVFPEYAEISADAVVSDEEDDDWYDQMMAESETPYEIYVPTYLFERAWAILEADEKAHSTEEQPAE